MFPQMKGKISRQAHVGIPEGTYEEEHARGGFFGRASHLYHLYPPTAWVRVEGPLRPRLFKGEAAEPSDLAVPGGTPQKFLWNSEVALWISRRSQAMPFFVRNADGDEVHFIHRGRGRLETDYGPLAYGPGDYLWIPKGTTYRVLPETQDGFTLIIESFRELGLPDRGLLGRHAFIDPGVFETPEPEPHDEAGEWEVLVKRGDEWTTLVYPFHPLDVVGWKGDLTVVRFNIRDLRPVVSPRYHVPPTVHTTFAAERLAVCTFVPRPFEADPEAQRVPFYHRNIDYDEVLFYHAGEFFSRHGVGPGALTLHPQGIHHGPHPKAFEAARAKAGTDEVAVLVETQVPYQVSQEAEKLEDPAYATNWAMP